MRGFLFSLIVIGWVMCLVSHASMDRPAEIGDVLGKLASGIAYNEGLIQQKDQEATQYETSAQVKEDEGDDRGAEADKERAEQLREEQRQAEAQKAALESGMDANSKSMEAAKSECCDKKGGGGGGGGGGGPMAMMPPPTDKKSEDKDDQTKAASSPAPAASTTASSTQTSASSGASSTDNSFSSKLAELSQPSEGNSDASSRASAETDRAVEQIFDDNRREIANLLPRTEEVSDGAPAETSSAEGAVTRPPSVRPPESVRERMSLAIDDKEAPPQFKSHSRSIGERLTRVMSGKSRVIADR